MKAYGMKRRDHQRCKQGCCAGKKEKLSGEFNPGFRTRRKTARQAARADCALPDNEA